MIQIPAIFITAYDDGFGKEPGQVWDTPVRIFITCPFCGMRYALPKPPFIFDEKAKSIGPASLGLNAAGCETHGYMHNGTWKIDKPCVGKPREHCFGD